MEVDGLAARGAGSCITVSRPDRRPAEAVVVGERHPAVVRGEVRRGACGVERTSWVVVAAGRPLCGVRFGMAFTAVFVGASTGMSAGVFAVG